MTIKPVILIVEDEAIIRMVAVQILEEAGFATLEANSADVALRILEVRADVRAVFTDINMPGTIDGLRLAHAVRGRWPPIHLILTSGLMSPRREDLPAGGRFIRKPYEAAHIVAMIHELLALDPPPDPIDDLSKAA
jgi:two-component system, response regulator PdtaR